MTNEFNLERYLSNGVDHIVKGILKASIINPSASKFMLKYIMCNQKARERRRIAEDRGEHIPPFMIASITDKCNLHCKGCYARANHSCLDLCGQSNQEGLLDAQEWRKVFTQASELGMEFILLAGGEPFVRRDVLIEAGKHSELLFPIFTNGTMIEEEYMQLLSNNRNLMPVISIEGNEDTTDTRRGTGIYKKLQETMKELHKKGILFGTSVTVTKQNLEEVLSDEFVQGLKMAGAKAVVYVEYVPMDEKESLLAPDDDSRKEMMQRLNVLREKEKEFIFISFPGDEKSSGGCLAAGRGFFHINAHGGAEPCPFSPYSDTNIKEKSLLEVLHSPLFQRLQEDGSLLEEHTGGCVLFQKKNKIEEYLGGKEA